MPANFDRYGDPYVRQGQLQYSGDPREQESRSAVRTAAGGALKMVGGMLKYAVVLGGIQLAKQVTGHIIAPAMGDLLEKGSWGRQINKGFHHNNGKQT